jgi:hypothetical protein
MARRQRRPAGGRRGYLPDPRVLATRFWTNDPSGDPAGRPGVDWAIALEAARLDPAASAPDLIFHAPVPTLLMLDYSADRAARAQVLRRRVMRGLRARPDGSAREPRPEDETIVLNTIAEEAASLVFAWMGLEAFANFTVAKAGPEFRYPRPTKKGSLEEWDRVQIEDRLSVREKIAEVVPLVLGRPPLGDAIVSRLDAMRELRRTLEHLRASDRYEAESLDEGTMGRLLRGAVPAPVIAVDVLQHFGEQWASVQLRKKVDALRLNRPNTPPAPYAS